MPVAADKAKERAANEAEMASSDWKSLMALPVFRRWLWQHGGTMATLDLRSPLMREAQVMCPLEFVEMVREGLQRENTVTATLRAEAVPASKDASRT